MEKDKQVIEEILAGKQEVYREFVSRYQNRVYSVALKYTNNPKDAEDVSQEVFIQAYKSLASFTFQSSLSTWLYRITINKCLDWKRKNKMMLLYNSNEYTNLLLQQNKMKQPEELLLLKDQQSLIKILLKKLPEGYQSVIILYYFDHLSYQQIAERLGIAKKTVESRLYRGKTLLKDLWKKGGYE